MMSRARHKALRHALYMPGLVARRHKKTLKMFADLLSVTGLAPEAVVGEVMRKFANLIY
jgi:transposase